MADVMMSIIFVKLNLQKTVSSVNFFSGANDLMLYLPRRATQWTRLGELIIFAIFVLFIESERSLLASLLRDKWRALVLEICKKPFLRLSFFPEPMTICFTYPGGQKSELEKEN